MVPLPTRTFAEVLRTYRLAAGLTQEQLATASGLSTRGINDLERGARRSPRSATVTLLAAALRLTAADCQALEIASRLRPAPLRGHQPGDSARCIPSPPLVGRSVAMAHLEAWLVGEGPDVLMLAGEPGIGKTRLLQEAATHAAATGYRVLRGSCHRRSGHEPYAPVSHAIALYLRQQPAANVRRYLDGCSYLTLLLPEVAEALADVPTFGSMPAEHGRRLMFLAVTRVLSHIAGPRGTLLVLDDLQWVGADALDLLDAVVREANGTVRVLGAYRDTDLRTGHPLPAFLLDRVRAEQADRILLRPLPIQEAERLLQMLLEDTQSTTESLRQEVLQRSGGIPFYLVSCAHDIRAGALAHQHALHVPWSVAELIRQRLADLPPSCQDVLELVAIVGGVVPCRMLFALAELPESECVAALDALCQAQLLVASGEDAVRIAHDLLREGVIAGLHAPRRVTLHRRVAEALERTSGERPVERLVHHYRLSGDTDKLLDSLELAGQRALLAHANATAIDHFSELVALLDAQGSTVRAAPARARLGAALTTSARYDEALSVLERAAADLQQAIDTQAMDAEGLVRATVSMGEMHILRETP